MTATTYPTSIDTHREPRVTHGIAMAAPILPGKVDDDRAYLESVSIGERKADHAASRRRAGISRESVWHQTTPHGVVAVAYLEGADTGSSMEALASSDAPFDVYFRDQVRRVHGLDFGADFTPPELLLEYGKATGASQAIAFTIPVLPGMTDRHREIMEAAWRGDQRDDHAASRRRAGITREMAWHQQSPDGVMSVVLIEADDTNAAMVTLATSDAPYDVAFRKRVRKIHGFELTDDFAPPELLLDFRA